MLSEYITPEKPKTPIGLKITLFLLVLIPASILAVCIVILSQPSGFVINF